MDDFDDALLGDALMRYALPVVPTKDGRRVIAAADARGVFLALLQQISDTLLPRRLIFRAGERAMIEVLAANRRLLRILHADAVLGADPSLMTNGLGVEPEAKVRQIALLFRRLAERDESISVESCRIDGVHDPSQMGVHVDLIARHFGADVVDTATRIEDFLSSVEAAPVGFMQLDAGEIMVAEGDDGTLSDLLDLSRMIWGEVEDSAVTTETAQFVILAADATGTGGLCTVLIQAATLRFVVQYDDCHALDLVALWLSAGSDRDDVIVPRAVVARQERALTGTDGQ